MAIKTERERESLSVNAMKTTIDTSYDIRKSYNSSAADISRKWTGIST